MGDISAFKFKLLNFINENKTIFSNVNECRADLKQSRNEFTEISCRLVDIFATNERQKTKAVYLHGEFLTSEVSEINKSSEQINQTLVLLDESRRLLDALDQEILGLKNCEVQSEPFSRMPFLSLTPRRRIFAPSQCTHLPTPEGWTAGLTESQLPSSSLDEEISFLMKQEVNLKQECRILRKKLAAQRQKQWYNQLVITPLSCQDRYSKATKRTAEIISSSDASFKCLDLAEEEQSASACNAPPHSYKQKNTEHLYTSADVNPSDVYENFKSPGLGANDKLSSPCYDLRGRDFDDNKDKRVLPQNVLMDDDLPDISNITDITSPQLKPALGVTRFKPLSQSLSGHNQSMENMEARKMANNRHFKFLTNF